MKRLLPFICAATWLLGGAALAQSPNGLVGGSKFNPPLPPPPPPPKIEAPVIPQMGPPPLPNYVAPAPPSFHDRVIRCLNEAAAGGLRGGKRDYYVRSCANR